MMKHFMAIYAQPWPVFDGTAQCKVIVQATSLKRALEIAEEKGEVVSISASLDVPILFDPRAGAVDVKLEGR